jgi:hypothetical protein
MADGITFRTVDGARWGAAGGTGTGGNLTPLQFDENMWELLTRIQALENDPPVAISVSGFTVIGSQFQVNMSDGSTRGPYDLPIATFRDTGVWINSFPYQVLDFFSVPHFGLYRVLISHTSPAGPAVFDPDAVDEVALSPTFGQPLYQLVFGEDTAIYDFGFFFPGKPGIGVDDGTPIAGHIFGRNCELPIGLPMDAKLRVAPNADLSFPIEVNGVVKGSLNFAAGVANGTITWTTLVAAPEGTVIAIMKPVALDPDARVLTVTFKANRVF